jgi:serine/threonine-protein kinase
MCAIVTIHSITERILCPACRSSNRLDANFCQQCGHDVLLDATYRITRVIKEGGMGVVYQAVDDDGAVYAIKEMHDRFTDPQERKEGIERFLHEALLLRRLKGHPGIPHVYRSFIDEGRYYLSMEFIFGEDLEDILKREKRFPEQQALVWADQLCDVLEYLHRNDLIYRDMKPSNVMLTRDGDVKVVDFGIAKLLQPGHRGTMIGTPGYAPPEQYQGIATEQSDVYALAATLHHLLTGRDPREEPPFSFPPARSIQPDVSLDTSQALEKALQLELGDRFKTVSEFRRALPIPTGDRRPTRTFDPIPATPPRPVHQRPAKPRTQLHALPPVPQPKAPAQPVPQPKAPAQPKTPARPAPHRRRRGGFAKAVRRLLGAGLITGGLYYAALTYQPELVAPIQEYVTSLIQEYVPEIQEYMRSEASPPPDNPANPPAGVLAVPLTFTVEAQVTANASEQAIREALLKNYLDQAREQYPNAQLIPGRLPGTIGRQETPLGGGYKRVTATMEGYVARE